MTRFEAYLTDRGYTGFTVSGHSGYAEEGSDIVCAAVSSAVSLAASLLEKCGDEVSVKTDASRALVSVEIAPSECGDRVIEALLEHLCGVAEDYRKYLSAVCIRR